MVTYKPLWKTLIDKDMKKTDLIRAGIVNSATLAKMGKDRYVSLKTVDEICQYLSCPITDVVSILLGNDATE